MSFTNLPIVQGVQERLLPFRPSTQRRARTAWLDPDTLGWESVSFDSGNPAPIANLWFPGAQHVVFVVTSVIGLGNMAIELSEIDGRNGLPGAQVTVAVPAPTFLRFGKDGDVLAATGLRGPIIVTTLIETGGVNGVTATVGIYLTAY
jgi:hypothetical protein